MNRRTFLAAGMAAAIAASGCLDEHDPQSGNETRDDVDDDRLEVNTDDVPDCLEREPADWDVVTDGPANPDPGTIAGRLDCAGASRPEPTGDVCTGFEVEYADGRDMVQSTGVEPYPEPPSAFDEETVTAFVYEYEEAYRRNRAVSSREDRLIGYSIGVEEDATRVLETDDPISVVRFQYHVTDHLIQYHTHAVSVGHGRGAAVYGVDETGIVRAAGEYVDSDEVDDVVPGETPDPLEDGDLLECF